MEANIVDIGSYLKAHGIKPSYQRMKIYEYLLEKRNHPTVDMIYKELSRDIPTLSKTTVYNTLNVFTEKKIANILLVEENEARYDAKMEIHGHFKCISCNEIHDVDINIENISLSTLDSFQIDEHHLYFKGICKECLEKKKN